MTPAVSLRGMVGIRLADVPLHVRRMAGQRALDKLVRDLHGEFDLLLDEAADLSRAVETPSERVYLVSREAYEREERRWVP